VRRTKKGKLVQSPEMDELIMFMAQKNIGLLIADPLATLHDGLENDNSEMAQVFTKLALAVRKQSRVPMLVAHHSRKPDAASSDSYAGDPFSSRGASAIHGSVRLMLTLNTASQKDAIELGIKGPEAHLNYSRLDVAKDSNSTLGKHTKWYECLSQRVGNIDHDDTAPALQMFDHRGQSDLLISELHEALRECEFDKDGCATYDQAVAAIRDSFPEVDDTVAKGYLETHFRKQQTRDGVMLRLDGKGKKAVLVTDLNWAKEAAE
jgi:hypothetical protein